MRGLIKLYEQTGRQAEWRRLVEEIVPDFTDPTSLGPRPGYEGQWFFVIEWRVGLLTAARDWDDAERLLGLRVEYDQRKAAPALASTPASWDGAQRNDIRSLATSLQHKGHIQFERGERACVTTLEESLDLCERISENEVAAATTQVLGVAYPPPVRDKTWDGPKNVSDIVLNCEKITMSSAERNVWGVWAL